MNKVLSYAGAGLVGLAAALLPARSSTGDFVQFSNTTAPGTTGFTGELIGGSPSVIDNSYASSSGVTAGYDDGVDSVLDTSINPNLQFFVTYFPLVDSGGGDVAVDFNKSTFPTAGETYTARLSFEDRLGAGAYAPNCIKFDNLTINNPNGIVDYQYDLSVDSDLDCIRDHFESGLVSDIMATPEQRTGYWNQTILPGYGWNDGEFYGDLTLTAIQGEGPTIPEPSTLAILAAALGAYALRRKRKRVSGTQC